MVQTNFKLSWEKNSSIKNYQENKKDQSFDNLVHDIHNPDY